MTNINDTTELLKTHITDDILSLCGLKDVKASKTSLYLKIKFENKMIVKQEFQVRDLLLTR